MPLGFADWQPFPDKSHSTTFSLPDFSGARADLATHFYQRYSIMMYERDNLKMLFLGRTRLHEKSIFLHTDDILAISLL